MKIGLIGLGKMGFNLALNMRDNNHTVIAYNRSPAKTKRAEKQGIIGAYSIQELIKKLNPPRSVWLMISAGPAVDEVIATLSPLLDKGDLIIDGGNSHYRDTIKRYRKLKEISLDFCDIGTSGGISGARGGVCMMIGAEPKV
ncbi:MAG: NAD(P)-binding domain-containing protein [Bacilli bacterium]|nr:NAD(P)-binding domain-containing protein [Bacilli bacterium]